MILGSGATLPKPGQPDGFNVPGSGAVLRRAYIGGDRFQHDIVIGGSGSRCAPCLSGNP
jgi:hypothetical protein